MQERQYYVYILTNKSNAVLYTGVTNDLEKRIFQHKNKLIDGFTKKYNVNKLVYFDSTSDIMSAIAREKQIKGWVRKKKIDLIKSINLNFNDLSKKWK
jgi:putative endonuclease